MLHTLYVVGCMGASLIKTWQNTPQASNCFPASSQLVAGSTRCLASSRLVLDEEIRDLPQGRRPTSVIREWPTIQLTATYQELERR